MKKVLFFPILAACFGLHACGGSAEHDSAGVILSEFVYDKAEFPSCHASTIVETSQGELMIALFGGKYESNADCSIWASHRREAEWEPPKLVADGMIDSVKTACWNPVFFQVPGGDLLLFYKVGKTVQDWSGWFIRSSDGGYSWSDPERLPDGILGPIKNKPILWGDRLLCGSSLERGGWRTYMEITDPQVTSWRTVGPLNNRKSQIQIIQPSLLRHADGTLQTICRGVDLRGNIISVFSHDGGETWDEPVSSGLPNNDSGLDAVALKDGRFLLVYNHIQATRSGAASRSPINVALSDNGCDWYSALVLEDSPGDEFSYPSVIQTSDGLVHVVYTWHRTCIKHVILDPSKMKIDPRRRIIDEQWVDSPKEQNQARKQTKVVVQPKIKKQADGEGQAGRRTHSEKQSEQGHWKTSVDSLLGQMTLAEKLGCLAGHWHPHDRGTHDLYAGSVPRLGIPDFKMEYAFHGIYTNGKSTLYPAPLALAAAFDSTLIRKVAGNIAHDCQARGIQAAFAPEVTLYNAGQEDTRSTTFGDDPEYASLCADAFAEGLTDYGIMPIGRYRASEGMSEEAQKDMLRRISSRGHLGGLQFRGECAGVRAVEDSQTNIAFLQEECGFDGLLISDMWQTKSTEMAFRGGLHIDLPKGEWLNAEKLGSLIDSGAISEQEVDERVRRILLTRECFSLTESPTPDFSIPENRPESKEASLEAARRSLVLLRNEGDILPLAESGENVIVLGNRVWRNSEYKGLGSVYPFSRITLGEALEGQPGFEILPAAKEYIDLTLSDNFFPDAQSGQRGLKAEYYSNSSLAGAPATTRTEKFVDYSWGDIAPVPTDENARFSARWSGIYRPAVDEIVRFSVSGEGRYVLLVDGQEVLRNDKADMDKERCRIFRAEGGRAYRIELQFACNTQAPDIQLIYAAIPAENLDTRLQEADKIIVSVGSDGDLDEETRFWVGLAAHFPEKSVIVMQSCDLRDMAWSQVGMGAIQAWHTGESAGQAIADLLLGRICPSGRMPITTDLYPFGFGMSYNRKFN